MPSYCAALPTLLLALSAAATYQWPDKRYEALEHVLVDNTGFNDAGFAAAVTPCTRYVSSPLNTTGRETAAQWQRVFFHDVSTGNIFNGLGGLDASIGFETGRPENKGAAMNDTLSWHANYYNQHVSMADLIAIGVVVSTVSCAGPVIDLKAGRIDALGGGASGVPEPESSAEDYFETMANLGLDATESIQFLACGHTIGSVHHSGFPEILGPEYVTSANTNGGCPFDATVAGFDNSVVQQYLDGTTLNPLVTSYNETNRSDLRIFSADGNVTMARLATSNEHFQDACRTIYSKALGVVPSSIQLFDVTPIAVKPVNVTIHVTSAGAVTFQGAIRLLGTQFDAPSAPARTVTVAWTGADNMEYTVDAGAPKLGQSVYLNTTNAYYAFSAPVSSAGIQSFIVRVTVGGSTTEYDNNGQRFTVVDGVAWLPVLSAFSVNQTASTFQGVISAAVSSLVNAGPVTATFNLPVPQVGAMNPTIKSYTVHLERSKKLGSSNYYLYSANTTPLQLPAGTTSRALKLASQGTLDISVELAPAPGSAPGPGSAASPGPAGRGSPRLTPREAPATLIDAFRKIAEVGIVMV